MTVSVGGDNKLSGIKIGLACEADMPQIMEIERSAISPPWTEGALLGEIYRDDSFFALASENDKAIGFCVLRRVSDEGELFQIAVAEHARRMGIGNLLMRAAIGCAEESGLQKVFLEVRKSNTAAIELYKKFGFTAAGERKKYYELPVEDAIIMTRVFTNANTVN